MKPRVLEIQKAIIKIENPYPKDDLIINYKDFLKYRDYLPYYKFNINVFNALIKLSNDTWNTKERINRLSILELIKRYGYYSNPEISYYRILKVKEPSNELFLSLFKLFKRCFNIEIPLSKRQVVMAQRTCNSMLFQIPLNSECEQWLCENAFTSDLILNRILKYQKKSSIITKWAIENYNHPKLKNRRADMVSWLIDEDLEFKVTKQTLIDDFEYLNAIDEKAVEDYIDELEVGEMMEAEFKETMENTDHTPYKKSNTNPWLFPEFKVTPPILKQTNRFHKTYDNQKIQDSSYNHTPAYDFEKMRDYFYKNIPEYTSKVMIWSIGYSRIDKKQKNNLLKRYYNDENYYSILKIAKRNKLIGLLKWCKQKEKLKPKPKIVRREKYYGTQPF